MTVSSSTRRAGPFNGNDVTTAFPFTFKVFATSDVAVYLTDPDGVQTLLSSNYTVTLNGDQGASPGGTVNYPTAGDPLAAGYKLDLVGSVPYTQGTDITNLGRFLPDVIERAFDKVTILVQQLLEKFARAITFPVGDTANNTLPAASERAGGSLAFDADGGVIVGPALGDLQAELDEAAAQASAAGAAANAAQLAQASAEGAEDAAVDARNAAAAAQVAAEAARDSVNTTGRVFSSTALGLAGTSNGQSFAVLSADLRSWNVYLNSAGSAVFQAASYTKAYLDAIATAVPVAASRIPLVEDEAGNVPLWLEDGGIAAHAVGGTFAPVLQGAVGLEELPASPNKVPLFYDEGDNVPVWLEDGFLEGLGFGPLLQQAIADVSAGSFAPINSPANSPRPAYTDGRTLWAWRARLAKYLRAGSGIARVLLTGDSWTEFVALPQQLANILYALYAKSGDGFISVNGTYMLNGITFAKSGWTAYDASTGAAPSFGTGIDGQSISAAGTAATVSIGNVTATELKIYYRKGTGTFRYRVDGGAWTAVAGDGSNTFGTVSITGLANAAHTLDIDTTGNAGTAVIHGFRATRSAVPGIELQKCGNSGLQSKHITNFVSEIASTAADLAPDVVIVALGTNDYRNVGNSPASYTAALGTLVAAYRSVLPNVGFVFIAPADTSDPANVVIPLSEYRDALYAWCVANGHEFYNENEELASWGATDPYGIWADTLHHNDDGGYLLARRINSKFLTI